MFCCPNCDAVVSRDANVCPVCKADFGKTSTWRPVDPNAQKRTEPYVPNVISGWNRSWYVIYALVLIAYCGLSLYSDTFYVPAKSGRGVTLHGARAAIMCIAILCGIACLISMVMDHYDRRDNEEAYKLFAMRAKYTGWGLFFLALFMNTGKDT